MKRPVCALSIAALSIAAAPGAASPTDADIAARIVGAALVGDGAYRKLAWLTDRIGPRLSGSRQLEEAIRWTAEELRRDGLDRVWAETVLVPHWVRGTESGRLVAPADHPLALLALGGSIGTGPEGLTAEVVEVSGFDELTALGADKVRGKIVFYNKAMVRNGGPTDGYGPVAHLRVNGAVEAAKLGAVGTLLRSAGTAASRLPHTGMMRYEDGVPKIPSVAISSEDADLIHRLLAAGETVKAQFTLGCRSLPDAESANVIGEIRGRERPHEIVLIGGHLDSWDVGTGAIDDGAGVAVVMETLRLLQALDLRPRRTVRAVLFTNEENGLRGGRAYAESHKDEMPRHVVAIESDSGGSRPLGFGVSAGPGGVEIVREIARHLRAIGAQDVRDGGGGADISPMEPLGVPQMNLRQETTQYFDYHHTMADTLDKVPPEDLAKNVASLAVMTYFLAEREESLPRIPPGSK